MLTFFFTFLFLVSNCYADHWVVLASGSNSWWNYRHQADILHAYQIVRAHGIPNSHIITMMYDDIAYNTENPYPGQVFNYNGGPNVYVDVFKDYTGDFVSAKNFLKVLRGDKSAPGKVLRTTKNDDIFIYLADHGAPGFFCFPNDNLWAHELIDTFQYMHKHKMYRQITIYVESCESGSLFNGILPNNMSIYALSAASPIESSYACCQNMSVNNFLCDCFSINWLQNSDDSNFFDETLIEQATIVQNLTTNSTVCQYGDLRVDKDLLSAFLAIKTQNLVKDKHNFKMSDIHDRSRLSNRDNVCTQGKVDSHCMKEYLKDHKMPLDETEIDNIIEKKICFI